MPSLSQSEFRVSATSIWDEITEYVSVLLSRTWQQNTYSFLAGVSKSLVNCKYPLFDADAIYSCRQFSIEATRHGRPKEDRANYWVCSTCINYTGLWQTCFRYSHLFPCSCSPGGIGHALALEFSAKGKFDVYLSCMHPLCVGNCTHRCIRLPCYRNREKCIRTRLAASARYHSPTTRRHLFGERCQDQGPSIRAHGRET